MHMLSIAFLLLAAVALLSMSSALLAFVPTGPPQLESRPRVNRSHRVGHSDDNAADSRRCMVAGSLLGLMMAVAPASSKRLPESRGVKTVDDLAHEGLCDSEPGSGCSCDCGGGPGCDCGCACDRCRSRRA
mmetsp:Transcript_28288/g.51060  ORF Transcript_28288/g.51060 Transcript_28288/m.51060 type:complete len:131 (+) Transcript_28288:53-445(+)